MGYTSLIGYNTLVKSFLRYASISITIAAISSGIYYVFVLKPALEAPIMLRESEQIITKHYLNLSQNRLAVMGLVNLDTSSYGVGDVKDTQIQLVSDSIDAGIDLIESSDYSIDQNIKDLSDRHKDILTRQKVVVDKLIDVDGVLSDLIAYDPITDLGTLDLEENKEEIIERTASANAGLEAIKLNITKNTDINKTETAKQLVQNIHLSQDKLSSISELLENEDFVEASKNLHEFVSIYSSIKDQSLELDLAVIRSPQMVKTLIDQTNLMNEYIYLLSVIDESQKELSKTLLAN
jgi:hypothetical protein